MTAKRSVPIAGVALLASGLFAGTAFAAKGGGGGGNLKCFAGAPASCVVSPSGATVTLDTSSGGYAGAYYTNSKNAGATLSAMTYSFNYECNPANDYTTCVGGGSPRWSIPIDTNGDSKTDGYAFLDAAGCGSTGSVSTADASCAINFQGVDYTNWAAFAAANPSYTIAAALPFVITDTTEPGTTLVWAVSVVNS